MLRVFLINNSVGLAGIERRFANIWLTLKRRGNVRPILVVPDTLAVILEHARLVRLPDELLWTVPEPALIRATGRVRSRPLHSLSARLRDYVLARAHGRLWPRMKRLEDAVLHIGYDSPALDPPVMPTVYECVDSTLKQLDSRHFRRAAARRCIVHCQTDRIRSALEQTMRARKPKWQTVISPCYFADYPPIASTPISKDPGLIAFVGRFSTEKNPLMFVEAIARVRAKGLDCRGLMLGQGPMRGAIEDRIEALGLRSAIEVGFTTRPLDRVSRAAVFVTLQDGDNYGSQSLLEAMGAGCAVIASDVGETARIVSSDVGVRIDLGVTALADAIEWMVSDPRRTAERGAAACHEARTQYSADTYAAFLESLYASAITRFHSNN